MAIQEIRATVTGHSADSLTRIATPRYMLISATGRSRPAAWLNATPLPGAVITGESADSLFLGIVARIMGRSEMTTVGRAHVAVPLRPDLAATIELTSRCVFLLGLRDLPPLRATITLTSRCRLGVGARFSMLGGG